MRTKITLITLVLLSLALGYLISLSVWYLINFPFANPYNAVGKLALLEFNPLSNYFRWGLAIILPSVVFFALIIILRKLRIFTFGFSELWADSDSKEKPIKSLVLKTTYAIFLLSFVYALLTFFAKDWTTSAFDMFHEGEQLTPAYNFITNGKIWSGTLFVHGALFDVFTAVLGWKVFAAASIGSYRVSVSFLNLLKDLSLLFLLYKTWQFLQKELQSTKAGLIITGIMSFLYLLTLRVQNLDRRNLPLILLLALLVASFNKRGKYYSLIAGALTGLSFFYSLDIGLYMLIISIFFISAQLAFKIRNLSESYKSFGLLILGFISSWLIILAVVGRTEFSFFLKDFRYLLRVKDLLDSYVYPYPNLLTNPRFTLPIIISALNFLLFLIFHFGLYAKKPELKKLEIVHLTYLFVSLLLYRTALGRSDLIHIETSSTFIFITLGFNIGLLIFITRLPVKIKEMAPVFVLLLSLLLLTYGYSRLNYKNLINFTDRTNKYTKVADTYYINESRRGGITRLQEIFKNEPCVFNLSSEASLPYLINKPSCGRLYISYLASAEPVRQELANTISVAKPNYILYSSKNWTQNLDSITNEQRFPLVMSYVNTHYKLFETVSDYWTVYVKRVEISK
jgi:hypothetical protein